MTARRLPENWLTLPLETRDAVLKMLIERRHQQGEHLSMQLVKADHTQPLAASLEQSFFLQQQARFGGRLAWTLAAPPIILEEVDVERVKTAIGALAARHDMLNAVFRPSDGGFEIRLKSSQAYTFTTRKLPITVAVTGPENWIRRRYEEMLKEPFDAQNGPLWRAELCSFAGRGVILLAFCSAIVDGDSLYLIDRDLRQLLAAPPVTSFEAKAFDYADYAATQAQMLHSGRFGGALEWWRERLSGGPPASWHDEREPLAPAQLYEQVLATETGRALENYAAAHRTTPPVVLLAEYMAQLRELDGGDAARIAAEASRQAPQGRPVAAQGKDARHWKPHGAGALKGSVRKVVEATMPRRPEPILARLALQ